MVSTNISTKNALELFLGTPLFIPDGSKKECEVDLLYH